MYIDKPECNKDRWCIDRPESNKDRWCIDRTECKKTVGVLIKLNVTRTVGVLIKLNVWTVGYSHMDTPTVLTYTSRDAFRMIHTRHVKNNPHTDCNV